MNKQRKTSHILNVVQYDETGIIGLNGAPVSGYALYLHTNINDGSIGIDSSADINALYLLKNGTKNFEISYDTSGSSKLFRLLPYESGSYFQIGNPSNAGGNYVFISEATYGNVMIGPGLANGQGNLTGATAATHKIQLNGAVFANSSIQASSFVVTGGASTGFLKANGTIDSSTYATQSYVGTQISNLIDAAPGTLDTLNELAAALGDDANFASTVTTALAGKQASLSGTGFVKISGTTISYDNSTYLTGITSSQVTTALGYTPVTNTRTITINGTAYDLSADRSWSIAAGVTSFNTRTGAITLSSADVTTALGYTPYNNTNPSGYITGITSANVTTALGYTPYNSTNPSGYITSSGSITGSAMSLNGFANQTEYIILNGPANGPVWKVRYDSATANRYVDLGFKDGNGVYTEGFKIYNGGTPTWAGNAIIHAGNIGSQSVSNATTAGGLSVHAGRNNEVNKIVRTDANGYIQAGWINTPSGAFSTAINKIYCSDDDYIRYQTSANFISNMGLLTTSNYTSYVNTLSYNGSSRLYTGSDGTRNTGWAYHQDNSTGLHWPNNGWHFYPKDATDMYLRSGGSESALVMNANGTTRGYVYANSSNEIGFLNNSRSWILRMTSSGDLIMDQNYGNSIVGVYSSTRFQGVYSMGNAYKLAIDGTSPGNLYGISWGHPNAGGQAGYLNDHGMMIMVNGVTYSAISSNIWARGTITANGSAFANGNRLIENNGGSWGISITGSAGSASSVAWGNVSGRPSWMTSGSLIASHSNANEWRNSGFYENDGGGSNWPSTTWYNSINVRHSNQSNYHGFQVAMSYYDNLLWFRSYQGSGTFQSWAYAISSANIGSQSVNYANSAGSASTATTATNLSGFDKTNPSFGAVYANNWFRVYGSCGLYQQDYGVHFARTEATHGSWQIWGGAKNGYSGLNIIDPQGYYNNIMYENGNGGAYSQNANGWQYYYHRGNNCFAMTTGTTSGSYRAYVGGSLYAEGDIVAYSDARLKTDVTTIDNPIDKVTQMRGVYYTKIGEEAKGRQTGVIAQEMNEVLPEVVTYASDIDTYGVSYGNIVGVLIEAIKEQQTQIEDLKNKLDLLTQNK